ncbi:hypothetical protein N7517_006064 [Penicillium concentricum]|uniref:Uncharacterized protein n=1 Tax=Penicillium concentricum TaxID=293559 RepID=A0A9W9S8R4_9EURO|nr:uncharacterized protein N7517_006064 [Penicillium concentricum]KAJ5374058.1 hypothetical protein N7517_006064 [Penicillium concentricum]
MGYLESKQKLGQTGWSEEHREDKVATFPSKEVGPNSPEPSQAFLPLYLEKSGNQPIGLDFSKLHLDYEDPNVLFTTLHAEYNTINWAIQDPHDWHYDVCEVAKIAKDKDKLLALLRQRQQEKLGEIQKAWETTKTLLTCQPSRWEKPPSNAVLWGSFIRLARNFSYDSFVACFGSYVTDDQPSTQPLLSTPTETYTAKPLQPRRISNGKMATSSGVAKSSSSASKSKPRRKSSKQGGVRRSTRLQQRDEQSSR